MGDIRSKCSNTKPSGTVRRDALALHQASLCELRCLINSIRGSDDANLTVVESSLRSGNADEREDSMSDLQRQVERFIKAIR